MRLRTQIWQKSLERENANRIQMNHRSVRKCLPISEKDRVHQGEAKNWLAFVKETDCIRCCEVEKCQNMDKRDDEARDWPETRSNVTWFWSAGDKGLVWSRIIIWIHSKIHSIPEVVFVIQLNTDCTHVAIHLKSWMYSNVGSDNQHWVNFELTSLNVDSTLIVTPYSNIQTCKVRERQGFHNAHFWPMRMPNSPANMANTIFGKPTPFRPLASEFFYLNPEIDFIASAEGSLDRIAFLFSS